MSWLSPDPRSVSKNSAEPVLGDTALVGRLRYVLAHEAKEGLVVAVLERTGGEMTL